MGAIAVLALIEGGSWFVTRIQLEGDAAYAAFAAANEVAGLPISMDTAATALDFAQRELAETVDGGEVDPSTLRLFADGTIRFTAIRTAPSPLLAHLDWTKDLMDVHVTVEGRPAEGQ